MESSCTLLIASEENRGNPPTQAELQKQLEDPDVTKKVAALKQVILLLLAGEQLPKILMTVIRFTITVENHELKKLLTLYWEVVPRYGADQKLLPEMILVCNALRNDLNHPNEYIRGSTLRFLCKLREPELIEPLIASVKSNLEHRHSYVRKNAVMAVFTIVRNFGVDFIPDADELIEKFLETETDMSARRNAFLMLYQCAQDRAVEYFSQHTDQVLKFGDGFQLVILELTRKVCRADPAQKSRFIKVVFQLLQSQSAAVSYEAAWTLVSLSAAPTAVRAAASAYTHLLTAESDNNVKLIVLDKLTDLKRHHGKVVQELLMDIMRALGSPNADIRRKILDIVMDLITPRNIGEVVLILKKEIVKTQSRDLDRAAASVYRQMLIKAIHGCAVKYPSIADSVVHVLIDFLNGEGALDVVLFVREIVQSYPELRASVLQKLIDCVPDVKAGNVYRVALWVLGEYAEGDLQMVALEAIKECIGSIPFTLKSQEDEEAAEDADGGAGAATAPTTKVTVLADGTYATQTALTSANAVDEEGAGENEPALRRLIMDGDYLLGSVAVTAMTKIAMRCASEQGLDAVPVKAIIIDLLLTCCSMIQVGQKALPTMRMDRDSFDRICLCMRALLEPQTAEQLRDVMLKDCRAIFGEMLEQQRQEREAQQRAAAVEIVAQPDDLISIRQLRPRRALGTTDIDLDDEGDLSKATGTGEVADFGKQLAHVYQLTGFSDPVYAEAQVTVHDYDIVLDILVINRTPNTLTNLAVELSTMGDLKLVERLQNFTIGPLDYRKFKANIKVSSTETGQIFGTIVYDSSTSAETTVINLNDIHVDIMDYIKPATCSDSSFRSMWAEFEWENKVAVNTQIDDVNVFLNHIVASTNMKCLTPTFALGGDCNFLAANLYAKSIFGEDALVNLSVERVNDKVEGYIRIRAKTQGIALSLGDRITLRQKSLPQEKVSQS